MALQPVHLSQLETLHPNQYFRFELKENIPQQYYQNTNIRVGVLDSTIHGRVQTIGVVLIPFVVLDDWVFPNKEIHHQILLKYPRLARLIIIGNVPKHSCLSNNVSIQYVPKQIPTKSSEYAKYIEDLFTPFLKDFCPKIGTVRVKFLKYTIIGEHVGEISIKDVQVTPDKHKFKRIMSIGRVPDFNRTEILVVPTVVPLEICKSNVQIPFRPNLSILVQSNLKAMVWGISLIAPYMDDRIEITGGRRPRVLVLGVGGGALVSFLNTQLGFEVIGVEADRIVLWAAMQLFGLKCERNTRLIVGNEIKVIRHIARRCRTKRFVRLPSEYVELKDGHDMVEVEGLEAKFEVVVVDLLPATKGPASTNSLPPEFVKKSVLRDLKAILLKGGVLIVNIYSLDQNQLLVDYLPRHFSEIYKIIIKDERRVILIATVSPVEGLTSERGDIFLRKLKSVISEDYLGAMVKI